MALVEIGLSFDVLDSIIEDTEKSIKRPNIPAVPSYGVLFELLRFSERTATTAEGLQTNKILQRLINTLFPLF